VQKLPKPQGNKQVKERSLIFLV